MEFRENRGESGGVFHKIQRLFPHVEKYLWKTVETFYFVAKTERFRTK